MRQKGLLLIVFIFCSGANIGFAEVPCDEGEGCNENSIAATNQTVQEIDYAQLTELMNSAEPVKILDVRSQASFEQGHIPGAGSLPFQEITPEKTAALLNKSDLIIVYCATTVCHLSDGAARKLLELGYKVVNYSGGVMDWIKNGQALEKNKI